MNIRVVITGRRYHTVEHLPDEITLPEGATLHDAIQRLRELLPPGEQFPAGCLVAVSNQHVGTLAQHENRPLRDGDELTFIAPVAGG